MLLETYLLLNPLVYLKTNMISWAAANKRIFLSSNTGVTADEIRYILGL